MKISWIFQEELWSHIDCGTAHAGNVIIAGIHHIKATSAVEHKDSVSSQMKATCVKKIDCIT
jgi:hypothetical protein